MVSIVSNFAYHQHKEVALLKEAKPSAADEESHSKHALSILLQATQHSRKLSEEILCKHFTAITAILLCDWWYISTRYK